MNAKKNELMMSNDDDDDDVDDDDAMLREIETVSWVIPFTNLTISEYIFINLSVSKQYSGIEIKT